MEAERSGPSEPARARVSAAVAADANSYARPGPLHAHPLVRVGLVAGAILSAGGGFLRWGLHARVDGATAGLLIAGAALALCLYTLYRMVSALARPSLQTMVEVEVGLGVLSDRELREERRRLLRAINELRFDFEMGKLSQADYDGVREGYELRAIEVMRAIDAGAELHPELAQRLEKADAGDAAGKNAGGKGKADETPAKGVTEQSDHSEPGQPGEPVAEPTPASASESASASASDAERMCGSCDSRNDQDARFCKKCGKELAA